MNVLPVVLSGGSGTRLWPASRASSPKQFMPLGDSQSLFQASLERCAQLKLKPPLVICNEDHRFLVLEQSAAQSVQPGAILLEPAGRNTAAAIALACFHHIESTADKPDDEVLLVLPSDHAITHLDAFREAVSKAIAPALDGCLVTFGIQATRPETGFGYIRAGDVWGGAVLSVQRFIEKPPAVEAEAYVQSGAYFWNSGMFCFRSRALLAELERFCPDICSAVRSSWHARATDGLFIRPNRPAWLSCPSDSIDYAVMQRTRQAVVVPASFGWSDVGNWQSLWDIAPKSEQGNHTSGDVLLLDTQNSLVRADHRQVTVIGLSDVVVVETSDAVLVMSQQSAQQVKQAVESLSAEGRTEVRVHRRVHRPWGWYEGLDHGDRFQVKRLMVKPGEKLSLQMHHHRAEHWVVVSGTARVTMNGVVSLLTENQSTYIPLGQQHRLENPGKLPLHIVEVQSGSYLGEDDIVRFEDDFGRADSTISTSETPAI